MRRMFPTRLLPRLGVPAIAQGSPRGGSVVLAAASAVEAVDQLEQGVALARSRASIGDVVRTGR